MDDNKTKLLIAAILTGTLLVPVNSTMITIGLNAMSESFGQTLAQTSWIVTIYLIVMAAVQPVAGKLGDMFGYRNMFLLGLCLSLAGSIACGLSYNLLTIILSRSFQALGGALAVPNATALIRFSVPENRLKRVLGMFGFMMGLGAAAGPLAGSLLLGVWGWTSIFWINIPFLILSFLLSAAVLPVTPVSPTKADLLGAFYLAASLSGIVLFITHPETIHWWSAALLLLGVVLFIYREQRIAYPLIEFKLFGSKSFAGANVSIAVSNCVMYGTILALPIVFQRQDMDLRHIGTLLFVFSLAMSFSSWAGGRLPVKLDGSRAVGCSFVLQLGAAVLYLFFHKDVSYTYLVFAMIVGGAGAGLGLPSMQTANLEAVGKEKTGVASGIFSTFRYMGSMMASALLSMMAGSQTFFYVMMAVSAGGIALSFVLRSRHVMKEDSAAS